MYDVTSEYVIDGTTWQHCEVICYECGGDGNDRAGGLWCPICGGKGYREWDQPVEEEDDHGDG